MDQLWGIALRAQSADISRAAIQYINSYYINGEFTVVLPTKLTQLNTNSLVLSCKSHVTLGCEYFNQCVFVFFFCCVYVDLSSW